MMETLLVVLGAAVIIAFGGIAIIRDQTKQQKAEREALLQLKRKPYETLAEDFVRVGWPTWGYAAHRLEGQDNRIHRAINSRSMKLVNYDASSKTALVQGERGKIYEITPLGCSCLDFTTRSLPCKHMYFAVMSVPDSIE